MHILTRSILSGALVALVPAAASALSFTTESDANALASTLFLNTPGLNVTNATLVSGASGQVGTYVNDSGTLGLPLNGIVLSSGNIADILVGTSTDYGGEATDAQNAQLSPITGQSTHFDVAQLVIDFEAAADVNSVTFFAAFASEEWPYYVNSAYTDGFGLFVNGTNVAGVAPTGGGANLPVNIDHPDMVAYGGVGILSPNGNPVLRFDVPVNSGASNTFSMIIADASDHILDTGVFISSFIPTNGDGGGEGAGSNEFNPLLPANNEPDPVTGAFVIELPLDVSNEQVIWIDPPIAVGYTYELSGPGQFASLVAPSLATVADLDGYTVTVGSLSALLAPGGSLDFLAAFGFLPTAFTLSGINTAIGLDPDDADAFPLGISFAGAGNGSTITMTPITENVGTVPLPAAGWLMLAGFGSLLALRRRRAV